MVTKYSVKEAIEKYYTIVNKYAPELICYEKNVLSGMDINIAEKSNITDLSILEKKYNIKLPNEIIEYFNAFWHGYIIGNCRTTENNFYDGILLMPILPYGDKENNEYLTHKYGIFKLSEEWISDGGSIDKYIPIGWTEYYGSLILYEIRTQKIKVC